ncbi:Ras GTPase-activating protein 1 [Geodia barretti]|nr:Ras GTPase-activating protein 1 [Geodia barretti]
MRHPFTSTKCQIRDVTVHLYAKKSRKKKCPSAVDKALEKVNVAMDEEDKKQTFTALQSKEAKLPFLYTDSVDKYWNDLRRDRKGGVPCNVLVVYSGMTREMCVEFLEKMDPGAYIVRSSISLENTFVFSFRNQTGIKHWQLSDREGKYYWGSSSGFHTLESFVEHFAEALSQVTHLHVYPGMTTALTPQFHTTEQQSMIGRLRAMDDRLGYGQLCRVIKDVNSEIRQGRKESIGRKPVPRKRGDSTANSSVQTEWDSTMVIAVNRLQAEEILNKEGRPGSFLVRPSEKTPGDYALAFRTTSEVRHWKMVQDGGKFYVHPRPNPYNNLEEIIQHFREAVGQETGLVMTPLVLDWSRTIVKVGPYFT